MKEPICCGSEIDRLVEHINQVTGAAGDVLGDLARTVRAMIEGEIDPYLLAGVLIEGAAQAVLQRVPEERREVASLALLQLLHDRLRRAQGDLPPQG